MSKKIFISGIVQGVGFRPLIYNLAIKYDIQGWVKNDENGVEIEVFSKENDFEKFICEIKQNPPILSKITDIKIINIELKEYKCFNIIQSSSSQNKTTIISPDIAICNDCIKDIEDIDNFRHNYSLTNCTNCGPRYSIIDSIPYDRMNTSLKDFKLCTNCEREFIEPINRRYHAQAISCEECGPITTLYTKDKKIVSNKMESISQSIKLIEDGNILAIKGMGGFHIVCDATNSKVIKRLREFKKRARKPFAVMFKNIEVVKLYTNISQKEEELLTSNEKPIVLLSKKENINLSEFIAPNIKKIGCFLPNTALQYLLVKELKNPIIATSANLKSEPIIIDKEDIFIKLYDLVDFVLDYNRDIVNSCDDSILQVIDKRVVKLRNSRGYTPILNSVKKGFNKHILALGANQKSTISIAFGHNIITSPYLGDLNSISTLENYKKTIKTFDKFYDFNPEIIVCDKHPNYESTKYAMKLKQKNKDIKLVQVQHHYAHILSVMAEYSLTKDVLGFVFDGTGYGDDGNIWGGEVFIANKKKYKRVKYLKYFKLLGGEIAIKEPKRIALSLLFEIYSLDEILNLDIPIVKLYNSNDIKVLYTMWQKNLNSPFCSSIGRLFDAIASLANIIHIQEYEGETGLLIESLYDKNIKESYSYEILEDNIDIKAMIKEILVDNDKVRISSKFINTLVNIIFDITKIYSLPVVLSGGVFQNKTLLELIIKRFKYEKIEFYINEKYSPNDECISLGQLYYLNNTI
ncbi:carbamoyltransferase HypF [Aliarcobacter lanthieri]|uniref:carbamoyltransferase HypF n=1 Tax=Aliarcobacter lanthieri TaxID=1355374 RepID=UPI00047B0597|nr:carbamoyltransferase HypF [Aliarcobacter lanthieri]QKF59062.1 [Ni-Fe] hydrogenase maturation protein HypF [Aliarcobacter lanthieri]